MVLPPANKTFDDSAGKTKILSSFLPFGRRDERMKNLPRYHSSLLPPGGGNTLCGIPSYPCAVTGAPVCAYSKFRHSRCCSQFGKSVRFVPRTTRHFSESASLLTTLRHRVSMDSMIPWPGKSVKQSKQPKKHERPKMKLSQMHNWRKAGNRRGRGGNEPGCGEKNRKNCLAPKTKQDYDEPI